MGVMKKHLFMYKYSHTIYGGFNDLIEKFGEGMIVHGDEVYILTDDKAYRNKGEVKAKGFKIYYSSWSNILKFLRMKLDTVCLCEPFIHYLIWGMLLKLFQPAIILNIYLCGSKTEKRTLREELVFKIAQRVAIDNFIPCTFYARDKAFKNKRMVERSKIVYCPVDVRKYKKTTGLHQKRLLSIDRLRARKNHLDMIEAFRIVHERDPEITLDIAGDYKKISDPTKNKDYAEKVFALVNKYQLNNAVTFHGSVGEEKKIRMLSEATIFLKTSHSEIQGTIATEAVASGLPVVAFDNSGTHEVVKAAGGVLVPDRQPQKMAEAILELIYDKPRLEQISEQSIESARRYSFENNIEYFYQTVTKKSLPSPQRNIEQLLLKYMKTCENPWDIKFRKGKKVTPYELEFIRKELGEGKILDSGGGNGMYTAVALTGLNADIAVLDQDQGMLEAGKTLFPKSKYVQGSCYKIPFGDGAFDGIFVRANMMYFNDRFRYIEELNRVLKPAGKLVIMERNRLDIITPLLYLLKKQNDPIEKPSDFVSLYEIRNLLKRAGFRVHKEKGFMLSTPALSRALFQRGGKLPLNILKRENNRLLKPFSRWILISSKKNSPDNGP